MYKQAQALYAEKLAEIEAAGLYKHERILSSVQGSHIEVAGREVLNFCANNYLGLSSHPQVIAAAHRALDQRGYGLSSVRFICGTQDLHKELEQAIAQFVGREDCILYSSCFDANGGIFETLLGESDAIFSDALNHASIIDGIRLCKAKRYRYDNGAIDQLEAQLASSKENIKLIVTDGVFSMDGYLAKLPQICDLAEKYGAMVMVDDSHATGFIGKRGRGTAEHFNVMDRVDIITSTLGKALGGASGGFVAAPKEIVELLRNRSRPYLFSNALAPMIVGATLEVLKLLSASTDLRDKLERNTARFRAGIVEQGLQVREGETPIVPIMLGDAKLAMNFASELLGENIYVIGFSYPVVPHGQARIRVQLSAAHETEDIDHAIAAFGRIGRKLGVVSAKG
jgi:glycine C-acetyltransferase